MNMQDDTQLLDVEDFVDKILDDELSHYGVLGMKWGVRKSPYTNTTSGVRKDKVTKTKLPRDFDGFTEADRPTYKTTESEKTLYDREFKYDFPVRQPHVIADGLFNNPHPKASKQRRYFTVSEYNYLAENYNKATNASKAAGDERMTKLRSEARFKNLKYGEKWSTLTEVPPAVKKTRVEYYNEAMKIVADEFNKSADSGNLNAHLTYVPGDSSKGYTASALLDFAYNPIDGTKIKHEKSEQYSGSVKLNFSSGMEFKGSELETIKKSDDTIKQGVQDILHELYSEDYLTHHGVKGMKWGIRKARPSSTSGMRLDEIDGEKRKQDKLSTAPSGNREPRKLLAKPKLQSKKTKVVMKSTNQELKTAIDRLRLEQEYARLTESKLSKFANKSIGKFADRATNVVTKQVVDAIFDQNSDKKKVDKNIDEAIKNLNDLIGKNSKKKKK